MRFNSEIITSRNNPTVKWAASLTDKKGRDKEKMFIAEGEKLTYEALEANLPVSKVFVSEGKAEKILTKLRSLEGKGLGSDCDVTVLADGVFERSSTAAAAIGYKELLPYLAGNATLESAVAELKTATRRYAKRQLTWFLAKDYVRVMPVDEGGYARKSEEIVNNAVILARSAWSML
jgi:hypothetical protein